MRLMGVLKGPWRWPALLALAVHGGLLVAALVNRSYLTDDSIQYLRIADNLVGEGAFSQAYFAPWVPDLQRTPGYPMFLVLLGRWMPLVLVVQHVLSLYSAWLIWVLLRERIPVQWAKGAGWSYAMMPYPALFASMVLSETLFIVLLLGAVVNYLRGLDRGEWKGLAVGLGLLGLAALVRPVAMPLLLCAWVHVLWLCVRRPVLRNWGAVLAFVVPGLLVDGWMVRNEVVGGRFALSVMGDMGMLHGRLGGLAAWQDGKGADEHGLYMYGDSIAAGKVGLPGLRTYYSSSQTHETELYADGVGGITVGYFLAHPLDAAGFELWSLWQMLKGVGYGWALALTGSSVVATGLAGLQVVLNLGMYLGFVMGLVRYGRRMPMWVWVCVAGIVVVLVVSAAAWADGRYRVVIDPLLVCMAGWERAQLGGRMKVGG